MLETIWSSGVETEATGAREAVARVCRRIPPLWDLPNYVAVNPFLGFAGEPIDQAARLVGDGLDGQLLPPLAYYQSRWEEGAIHRDDLGRAARRAGYDPGALEEILAGRRPIPLRPSCEVLTFAERHDREHGTDWNGELIRSITRWCAVHASRGGASWPLATAGRGLYPSWREAAGVDRSLEIAGLRGWRAWVAGLPHEPLAVISLLLEALCIPAEWHEAYLYRLLGGVYGWASYTRRASWQGAEEEPGAVADLLAIRIGADAAVARLGGRRFLPEPAAKAEDESIRLVFQEALEDCYARNLLTSLNAPAESVPPPRPAVQAVFCIDVRSEPLRRHFESLDGGIETRGFAGFFGVALAWRTDCDTSARCPVLLEPALTLGRAAHPRKASPRDCLKYVQGSPAAAFSFVELLGLGYGIGLACDALTATRVPGSTEGSDAFTLEGQGLGLEERIDLAAGILKNMGLRSFARLILLCGHEGRSANNPHAAGLHCGACGGHGGAINARVAAALLNDPAVRAGLAERGRHVPADSYFLPGVHDTSLDEVTLLDLGRVPSTHAVDVSRLRAWLSRAGALVRRERAAALGLGGKREAALVQFLERRARDWSEVRPEWGLARNAAFIAARRCRTRGVDLGGGTFLHEYEARDDADNSVLGLILSAPLVVASWINLQYFASTVDNQVFGCGTKTLHNRAGALGVVLGNGGDLRTGLPLQSVHGPGGRWFHEPLRLQVVVEATTQRIDEALSCHPEVRDLVENGWVRLFALDPESPRASRRVPGQGWQDVAWEKG